MPASNRISIRPDEVLGISRDSTPEEINRARGRLAKMLHPDMGGGQSTAIMQLINHAVEVMMAGQQGSYTFGGGAEQTEPPPPGAGQQGGRRREPPPPGGGQRREPPPGSGQQGSQQQGCPHPKKPGYSQCFRCSGVQPCPCGEGYYHPPNDRCRNCRARARGSGGHGRTGGYRGGHRGRRG